MRLVWLVFAVLHASEPAATAAFSKKSVNEFVDACTEAFDRSSGNGTTGVGRTICQCTAKESKHEGVAESALKTETARIKADPKNQIQDRRLLNAFHYCAIETMKQ